MEETKICTKCNLPKPISEFWWQSKRLGKRQPRCSSCKSEQLNNYYAINPERRSLVQTSTKETRLINAKKVYEYLVSHPCVDCGETDPIVLEFDHVRGIKRFAISRVASSASKWETIQEEIDKCNVRCANCHRRKTAKERGFYKYIT